MFKRILVVFFVALSLGCGHPLADQSESPNPDETSSVAPSDQAISFVTFGDWGTGGDDQKAVAQEIGLYCAEQNCEFVLTLGDNFYSSGVKDTSDEQWQEKYRDVYGSLGLPFYASLGNHDNKGDIQAQVDYSQIDSSWHMPAEYYSFAMPEGSATPVVEFFIINSDYPNFSKDEAAQQWLDEAIGASQATWKILAMHHPIYSNGSHGDDTEGNNQDLIPIICNRIDLVLSGHDHDFAYLRSSEDGCPIEQLVIGTGGAGLREVDTEDPRVVSTGSLHGFGWLQATSSQLTFRMIQTDGAVFYSTFWSKP